MGGAKALGLVSHTELVVEDSERRDLSLLSLARFSAMASKDLPLIIVDAASRANSFKPWYKESVVELALDEPRENRDIAELFPLLILLFCCFCGVLCSNYD